MTRTRFVILFVIASCSAFDALGQSSTSCSSLAAVKLEGIEITKAELVAAGTIVPPPYPGAPSIGPLPAH